jgi:CRP/FNR family cyclic AMP-dependent transcriptional regulator
MKEGSFNLKNLKVINFKAGDLLFKEGDKGFAFYIIQEGKVEVFKTSEEGKKVVIGTVESGQPLGEFAFVTQSPRSASARVVADGFAIEVSADAYKKLFAELPEWASAIIESLIERLKSTNHLLLKQSEQWSDEVSVTVHDVLDKMRG